MELQKEKNRIFATNETGRLVAEITFPDAGNGLVDIDHTFVDDSLRGQGAAGQLVEAAVKQIASEGKKAKVTCSYAVKWFQKHEEYRDILAD
ncbi:N-acetyltransferase [Anaerovorax odorimutans]|uniref:N-acetyltransferase n=1 Tax=Anaerovorax odorimutans TaxID=109327 RepID=A0ABT1RKM5_9FIRM|nr:GNAT family N-acetyltransferase [Anaerovorax odorimutans]MCQ4635740.1 N-acetyltransferase [Anaerovorax odorimutans]